MKFRVRFLMTAWVANPYFRHKISPNMESTTHSFYLKCWNCQRENIPYVFRMAENAAPGSTTVQVPCPFCQKTMTVEIPFDLPANATAVKHLPTKKG